MLNALVGMHGVFQCEVRLWGSPSAWYAARQRAQSTLGSTLCISRCFRWLLATPQVLLSVLRLDEVDALAARPQPAVLARAVRGRLNRWRWLKTLETGKLDDLEDLYLEARW